MQFAIFFEVHKSESGSIWFEKEFRNFDLIYYSKFFLMNKKFIN